MMSKRVEWDNHDALRDLFVGKTVTVVDADANRLALSDGTRLRIVGNSDCCAGYDITKLLPVENVITNVEVTADPGGDYYEKYQGTYRLFVFTAHEKINMVELEGTDSNGYYGTGFWIEVENDD